MCVCVRVRVCLRVFVCVCSCACSHARTQCRGWPRIHGSESPLSEGVPRHHFPLPLTSGELGSVLEWSLLVWVHLYVYSRRCVEGRVNPGPQSPSATHRPAPLCWDELLPLLAPQCPHLWIGRPNSFLLWFL